MTDIALAQSGPTQGAGRATTSVMVFAPGRSAGAHDERRGKEGRLIMQTTALALVFLLAGIAPSKESLAAASASVRFDLNNGPPFSVSIDHTGFATFPGPPPLLSFLLGPGESADLSFNYAISVTDDGLPLEPMNPNFPPPGFSCIVLPHPPTTPSHTYCGPPSGVTREQASALFAVNLTHPWNPAGISFDGTGAGLSTNADSFADALSRSGSTHVHVTNLSVVPQRVTFEAELAAWVLASPIPEPATFSQILAGLGLLHALRARRRRKRVVAG
jgi:hypothetical protein